MYTIKHTGPLAIRGSILFAMAFALSAKHATVSQAQEKIVRAILELPDEDQTTFTAKEIIEHCSRELANRATEKSDAIVTLLRKRGMAYARSRELKSALADLERACALQPRGAVVRCQRAIILSALDRRKEAIEDYKEALRIDPKSFWAWFGLAAEELEQGNDRKAKELLDKALACEPENPAALIMHADMYLLVDPNITLEAITRYFQLGPNIPLPAPEMPHLLRGFALELMNRPKEALPSLLAARAHNRKSTEVARELATVYSDLGKFNLAVHYAEEYVKLDPKDPVGYSLCARCYSKCGMMKEAIAAADRHISLSKTGKHAPSEIAADCVAVGRYGLALEYYDKALAEKPGHFFASVGKASLLATCPQRELRNGNEALKIATGVHDDTGDKNYQKWRAAIALAEAHAEVGNFKDAARLAKRAIELAGRECGQIEALNEKLMLFEKGQPFHMKAPIR